ncbi:MAG: AMP-binding protein [Deltaproteobacteria bacterium]|jgi:acyl-CoA synthetase (AMP-forming)/AMP-acid ligase II|nr:AMP-binding protein [Deltaproteobacteria bacterium]
MDTSTNNPEESRNSEESRFNIASLLTQAVRQNPDKLAVVNKRGPDCLGRTKLSYAQLDEDSNLLARGLLNSPLQIGDRVVVMVPQGPDFFVVIFGLFKAGLVPVMVDPGMGLKRMLSCLAEAKPQGLVGTKLAHMASLIMPRYFAGIKHRVTLGRTFFWGGDSLAALLTRSGPAENAEPAPTLADDPAAVLFTSGATGPAKGTIYTHSMFRAQVKLIDETFALGKDGADLSTFPLFSLFTSALGLTAVIPNMNPAKPGSADPKKIIQTINEEKCTSIFASPALLMRLAGYVKDNDLKFPTLNRAISAGAPIQPQAAIDFAKAMAPGAKLSTPYGATEGMPLTSIDVGEIAEVRGMTEQGFGMCVGRPLPGHKMAVIPLTDSPMNSFSERQILPMGEVGEFVASGPVVALEYFERPKETEMSLVKGPDQKTWRRMGDCGWQDAQGRMWFCGRKSQRVVSGKTVYFTISCEAIFNNHPKVKRSALVGVETPDKTKPVMIIEPMERMTPKQWAVLVEELRALGRSNPRTMSIESFLSHPGFPVDIRHNAKINREKLAKWANVKIHKVLPVE